MIYLSSKTCKIIRTKLIKLIELTLLIEMVHYISKSVFTSNIGIDPKLVKDKKKLLLKLQYTFPDKDFIEIKKKINGKNFFILKKNNTR